MLHWLSTHHASGLAHSAYLLPDCLSTHHASGLAHPTHLPLPDCLSTHHASGLAHPTHLLPAASVATVGVLTRRAAAHVWGHLRELHSGSHWWHRHVVAAEAASVELAGATTLLHGGFLVLVVAHAAHQKSRENAAHESAAVHLLGHAALFVVAGLAAMRLGRLGLLPLDLLLTGERCRNLAAVLARLRLAAVLAVAHERFGLFVAHGGLSIQARRATGRHGRVLRHLDGRRRVAGVTRIFQIIFWHIFTEFRLRNIPTAGFLGTATLLHAADVLDAGALLVGRLDVAIGLRLGVLSRLCLLALDLAA